MEPKLTLSPTGEKIHYSVGAIISDNDGKIVMIDRLKSPFGFACPAGHVDEGETSTNAIIREVEEETGLKVESIMRLNIDADETIPTEPCRHGVHNHQWIIYDVKATGLLILKEDEVKSIGWYTAEQIKTLQLETIWGYWLRKLNII